MNDGHAQYDIVLLGVDQILPTEESDPDLVEALLTEISVTGIWTHPVLVDDKSFAVMDGHHRVAVAKRLGLRTVPAVLLSYDDSRVRLESWRDNEVFTPEEVRERALSGRLLPSKSTRHIIEPWPPQTRVQLAHLYKETERGAVVDAALPPNSRIATLIPFYHRLGAAIGLLTGAAVRVGTETAETQAPHPALRQLLQSDPAMAALLPAASARIALGASDHAPFFIKRSGVVMLPPVLLGDSAALAAAARWALEAWFLLSVQPTTTPSITAALSAALRHGAALVAQLSPDQRELVTDHVPDFVAAAMAEGEAFQMAPNLLQWQASRIEGLGGQGGVAEPFDCGELSLPIERFLVAGGDSRLIVDQSTGMNRYGTTPRPRPEAVQFSSSTASSISDYGFMLCDMLRRDLMAAALRDGIAIEDLRGRTVDALGAELTALLGLRPSDADVVLAPSGTDTELLAVLFALAADDRPLSNILIAPEESGRGVATAAAGCFFDDVSASGAAIQKGEAAWPSREIEVIQVAIRGTGGRMRPHAEIDAELSEIARRALADGRRLLLHMLASSKTGLSAPSVEVAGEIERLAPDRVDVVVDACQMRNPLAEIGGWVRRKWMVQTSGSKFFTGPPFSGALVAPRLLRMRAKQVRHLLAAAPAVARPEDWNGWWRDSLDRSPLSSAAGFAHLFRALPAIAEAHLLSALPPELCRYAFARFREAVKARLAVSPNLVAIDELDEVVDETPGEAASDLSTHSIVCFAIVRPDDDGGGQKLNPEECQRLFELLNLDMSEKLGPLSPADKVRAAQCAHIGQPVSLRTGEDEGTLAVLRLVVGARFFTIVGHAGPGAIEAALDSEISDVFRAIEKIELLATRWRDLDQTASGSM